MEPAAFHSLVLVGGNTVLIEIYFNKLHLTLEKYKPVEDLDKSRENFFFRFSGKNPDQAMVNIMKISESIHQNPSDVIMKGRCSSLNDNAHAEAGMSNSNFFGNLKWNRIRLLTFKNN
ncbi:hypothetical protein PRIPAC_91750 [Pristionchus pacificus]|uniref:Uncharacterized protein n=1 Tax=Pristionchus pacificus TaxID=54126 RepID=A0A454Y5T8_PRIPA|nr:hypothetical protein PRIPAC_91750 [Pristionchus pacificus]|eukprot:PDM76232.1 hypothetical protein PRIPAC_39836 [Pristionchus pacificus]